MSDWRPIDTAPKDGTQVLIWCKPAPWANQGYFVGKWDGDRWLLRGEDTGGMGGSQLKSGTPTFWAPLPPEPA